MLKIQELDHEIDRLMEELVLAVQSCVQIDSVKNCQEAAPGAPFGQGIKQCLEWTLALGNSMGFKVKNIDGYVGHIEMGSGELLGVLGHLDVVPTGDGWTVQPFGGEIIGDRIYGRGTIDDKGPTLAALFAMKAIQNVKLPLKKTVRLILGTDEESGWADIDYYRTKEELPIYGFAPDAEFPLINAEKGILHIEFIKSLERLPHLVRITGGERPNIVPDFCEVVLKDINHDQLAGALQMFAFAEGFSGSIMGTNQSEGLVTLGFRGSSAHGSLPQNGKNAIIQALHFVQKLPLTDTEQRVISWLSENPGNGFHGEGMNIELSDEVSGKLSLNFGQIKMTEESLSFVLDIRYPVTAKLEQLLKRLSEKTLNTAFEFKILNHHEPHHVDKDSALVKALLQAYADVTGKEAYTFAIGGGTYAKVLPQGVAFGPLFPGDPEVMHSPDEYISLSTLKTAVAVYAHAIFNLAVSAD